MLFYIDPGAGGQLLQIIIAAVLAIGVFFGALKERILGLFRRRKPEAEKPPKEDLPL